MSWIAGYGCNSAAGENAAEFWRSLVSGSPGHRGEGQTLTWRERNAPTTRGLLGEKILTAYHEASASLPPETRERLRSGAGVGVILASTKGMLEDFVWNANAAELTRDPLTPLLDDFLKTTELRPRKSLVVSNACSSVLSAARLALTWIQRQNFSEVVIVSADAATSFVQKGFGSLNLLTPDQIRPFDRGRTGFYLGDAACALVLSATPSKFRLSGIGLDAEGSPVTRPSASGASLVRAGEQLHETTPDAVIAYGTGTLINDETEDLAFSKLFSNRPAITGTKWCVGHTLAVSGGLDLIAACKILDEQKLFRLPFTENVGFENSYLTAKSALPQGPFRKVWVSSLGFGGVHASALLELTP